MKILAALTYYHPHWTGLTATAKRVAEGMAARGHEVTVLTSRFESRLPREETIGGVRIVRLPVLSRLSRGVLMPAFPVVANRLMAQTDVVQIHTPMLEAPLLTALARRHGARAVITHHGDLVMPARPFDRVVERTVTALLRRALTAADRIVVYTRDYLEHSTFLSPFGEKCVPIAPPVVVARPDRDAIARWRGELGLTGRPLVGFAGRFVEEKGFDFLLRAVPDIAARIPGVAFAYAGDRDVAYEDFFGACRDLVRQAEPHLHWLGLIRDPQRLADFYAMCDLIAVPSRTDNLPLVPLEAMACGTPCVITDIPGARMAIRWTGMGTLVAPQSTAALTEGICEVLSNPAVYRRPADEAARILDHGHAIDEYERALTQFP